LKLNPYLAYEEALISKLDREWNKKKKSDRSEIYVEEEKTKIIKKT
tara:strand:- start:229 stop:366 length:138 start_codon:yes stop_codon:yes gene_type:complete